MGEPVRVLILEDSNRGADRILQELRRSGFDPDWTRVEAPTDFLAALRRAPDVILADDELPGYSALQALDAAGESCAGAPLIVIAGAADESRVVECMQRGASDFLVWDRLGRLGPAVKRALQRGSSSRASRQGETQASLAGSLLAQAPDAVFSTDLHYQVTSWNPGAEQVYGWPAEATIGRSTAEIIPLFSPEAMQAVEGVLKSRGGWKGELARRRKDGSVVRLLSSITTMVDGQGRPGGYACVDRDLSDPGKARELSLHYQLLSEEGRDMILFVRLRDDRILEANPAAARAYGYSYEELLELTLDDLHHPSSWENLPEQLEQAGRTGSLFEAVHVRKDGSAFPVEVSAHGMDLGAERALVCLVRDVTERKRAEESLRAANEQLSAILNASPVAIIAVDRGGRVTTWTPSAELMFGWQAEEVIGKFYPLVDEGMAPAFLDQLDRSNAGFNVNVSFALRLRKDGSSIPVAARSAPLHNASGDVTGTMIILEDISESLRTAEALQQSNAQLGALIDASPLAIVSLDREGRVVTWNARAEEIFEVPAGEMIGRLFDGQAAQELERFQSASRASARRDFLTVQDMVRARRDGSQIELRMYAAIQLGPNGEPAGIIGIYSDITDQRRQERERETIIRAASSLRIAEKSAEMFPVTLEQLDSLPNLKSAAIGLYLPGTSQFKVELARGEWKPLTGKITGPATSLVWSAMREGRPVGVSAQAAESDPLLAPSDEITSVLAVPLIARNEVIGAVWAGGSAPFQRNDLVTARAIADIAANAIYRAGLFDQMELAYQRLGILRTIDQAISSSLDLRLVLDLLINQITSQLHLDRAMIYLYFPAKQSLEFAIGSGVPTSGFVKRSFRLGESHIGRVAVKRELEYTPDLSQVDDEFGRQIYTYEGFVTYVAIPLIAKGQVKGVMEIFHRSRIDPDLDWLDFLKALGTQTAIAIDNAELFGQLQRANTNLTLALDSTLEGWSRVLDLRNKDVANHSQLVTSMALRIASRMGIPATEQVHIRRGALLHDVGKAGIPDEILYKPGPLSAEEWDLVRRGPESAVELLRSITYLQPAITIPAFHHEKWDGSGYPHGLKGEQIPLAARILAVADVWYALQEDRPYRPAWSQAEALEYLQQQRGVQFDPRVVDVFLEILENSSETNEVYSNVR